MTDKLVPNILDVRSKMESEHSDNLLTAVGDFANSLENKIADNNLGYLICLNRLLKNPPSLLHVVAQVEG
jgi:hypothetical protein